MERRKIPSNEDLYLNGDEDMAKIPAFSASTAYSKGDEVKLFYEAGAITNVDYSSDFLVDREVSYDDETFFNIGLQAVDSSEKLYFTVNTR